MARRPARGDLAREREEARQLQVLVRDPERGEGARRDGLHVARVPGSRYLAVDRDPRLAEGDHARRRSRSDTASPVKRRGGRRVRERKDPYAILTGGPEGTETKASRMIRES